MYVIVIDALGRDISKPKFDLHSIMQIFLKSKHTIIVSYFYQAFCISCIAETVLKGIVDPKMRILSSFTLK